MPQSPARPNKKKKWWYLFRLRTSPRCHGGHRWMTRWTCYERYPVWNTSKKRPPPHTHTLILWGSILRDQLRIAGTNASQDWSPICDHTETNIVKTKGSSLIHTVISIRPAGASLRSPYFPFFMAFLLNFRSMFFQVDPLKLACFYFEDVFLADISLVLVVRIVFPTRTPVFLAFSARTPNKKLLPPARRF